MKSRLGALLPLAVTALFLWLALRSVRWGEVAAHLGAADLPLFLLAVLIATLGIHVRALRWAPLLQPVRPGVPLRPRVAGVAVGLAANNLLPARAGEFVRAVVCARLARLPVPAVFGTLVVERMLDGIVVVSLLLGVVALEGFPSDSQAVQAAQTGARAMAALSLVLGVLLLGLALYPHRAVSLLERAAGRWLPARFRRPLVAALESVLDGVAVLRSPRLFLVSAAWALAQWTFLGLSYLLAMRALGIPEPGYAGALFLQSLVSLAVALPAAPGFVGVFHAAAVLGLSLYGVDADRAAAFAVAFHLGGWLGVTGTGLYYLARLRLTWRELLGARSGAAEPGGRG